eukprot:CAMPEP_0179908734 /NCGR_PEP_ID=MMETSP0982-20121206/44782_1 /TAXON_ID=483367 /ORGANISM="non described non described, Strain CCMP 2436" /LENGTH=59 /DNA_ID=CAMNT_0021810021 /DNA_START=169 /DNA_END=345 /DNA_ORIENTATION=-
MLDVRLLDAAPSARCCAAYIPQKLSFLVQKEENVNDVVAVDRRARYALTSMKKLHSARS